MPLNDAARLTRVSTMSRGIIGTRPTVETVIRCGEMAWPRYGATGGVIGVVGAVLAGALTLASGSFLVDPLVALVIAGAIIVPTLQTVAGSHRDLIWPENVSCGHGPTAPAPQ